jgi:hypothetical protein
VAPPAASDPSSVGDSSPVATAAPGATRATPERSVPHQSVPSGISAIEVMPPGTPASRPSKRQPCGVRVSCPSPREAPIQTRSPRRAAAST